MHAKINSIEKYKEGEWNSRPGGEHGHRRRAAKDGGSRGGCRRPAGVPAEKFRMPQRDGGGLAGFRVARRHDEGGHGVAAMMVCDLDGGADHGGKVRLW